MGWDKYPARLLWGHIFATVSCPRPAVLNPSSSSRMFRELLVVAIMAAALAAPAQDGAAPSVDGFISLVKRIEKASFFAALPQAEKMITFEMLAAAETNNLGAILDQLGYYRLLTYIDHLPKDYSHDFITYLKAHLAGGIKAN